MLSFRKKLNKSIKNRRSLKNYRVPLTSRRMRRKFVRRIRPAIYALNITRKKKSFLKRMQTKSTLKKRAIKKLHVGHLYTPERIAAILSVGQSKINLAYLQEYITAIKDRIWNKQHKFVFKKRWYRLPILDFQEKEFNINIAYQLLDAIHLKYDLEKECVEENQIFIDQLVNEKLNLPEPKPSSDFVKRKSMLDLRNKKRFYFLDTEPEDRSKKLLKNMILLDVLIAAKLEMGERIFTNNKNEKIKNYFMGIRNEHAIYNMNLIIIGLRLTLGAITSRIKYKKRTLINYSNPRNHGNFHLSYTPIHEFPKDLFLVTWKKWIGGILTNFKRLSKRIISRMKHDKQKNKDNKKIGKEDMVEDYRIAFPRDVPKLPAFVVSTTDCHWTLNESKRMKIKTTQLIEISHLGYFGDINLAINTHYLGLRSFTSILQECILHTRRHAKFLHKDYFTSLLDISTLDWPGNKRRARKIANKFAPKCAVSELFELPKKIIPPMKPQNLHISKQVKNTKTSSKKQVVLKQQPSVNNPIVSKPKQKEWIIQSPDRFQFPDRIQRLGGYLSWDKIKKNPEKYAFNVNAKIVE